MSRTSRPVRAAVGGTNRRAGLRGDGTGSRVTERDDPEAVEVVTLESLMDHYGIDSVDLLKLDCEGAEWDILPAAERVLPRVRQICMEFHCERGWTRREAGGLAASARLHRVSHGRPLEWAALGDAIGRPAPAIGLTPRLSSPRSLAGTLDWGKAFDRDPSFSSRNAGQSPIFAT